MNIIKIATISTFLFSVMSFASQNVQAQPSSLTAIEKSASIADASVFRISCPETHSMGTGFLIKSDIILTASHVVDSCRNPKIILRDGKIVNTQVKAYDDGPDMAALISDVPIKGKTFKLSPKGSTLHLGEEVVTWGFPGGYNGITPFLSVGYFGGINPYQDKEGRKTLKYIINAAFNHGNSGGPLISTETGALIGVVTDKLLPFNPLTIQAVNVLQGNKSGFQYGISQASSAQSPSETSVSESQVISLVLRDLLNNAQIVVGMSTSADDVRKFLSDNNISL